MIFKTRWLAALAVFTAACVEIEDEVATRAQASGTDTIVSVSLARAVAETYQLAEGGAVRHVRTSSQLRDAQQRPALYAFNFHEDGYAIVSAELEFSPILAFADTGTVDLANLPPGPDEWADGMRIAIASVRDRSDGDAPEVKQRVASDRGERVQWQLLLDPLASRSDVDAAELARARAVTTPDVCYTCPPVDPLPTCTSYTTTTKGPLVPARWGQLCPYNQYTPATSIQSLCYHAPTGCGATAIAQVVHYHRRAKWNYNWGGMPLGTPGNTTGDVWARAALLAHMGQDSGTVYGDYASSSTVPGVSAAFAMNGYASTWNTLGPNPGAIFNPEIAANRPVLVRGAGAPGSGHGAHIWVVSGHKQKLGHPQPCKFGTGISQNFYNFNWGWGYPSESWYKTNDYGVYGNYRYYVTARPL